MHGPVTAQCIAQAFDGFQCVADNEDGTDDGANVVADDENDIDTIIVSKNC